jgi:hypothetical protein
MGNKIYQIEKGFLHSTFTGDIDMESINEFVDNVAPYITTAEAPLHFVVDAQNEGRWSLSARREFTSMFDEEPRYGKVAIVNASRFTRVAATFMMKATGRDDSVRFFDTEAEAMTWLKE